MDDKDKQVVCPQPLCTPTATLFSLPVHDSVNGMRYPTLFNVGFVLDDFSQL